MSLSPALLRRSGYAKAKGEGFRVRSMIRGLLASPAEAFGIGELRSRSSKGCLTKKKPCIRLRRLLWVFLFLTHTKASF